MATNKKDKSDFPEIITNNALPTLFVDNVIVSSRDDGLNYIRFTTALPDGWKEEARMMIPMHSLKGMLDALCRHCDYFPEKENKSVTMSKTAKKDE